MLSKEIQIAFDEFVIARNKELLMLCRNCGRAEREHTSLSKTCFMQISNQQTQYNPAGSDYGRDAQASSNNDHPWHRPMKEYLKDHDPGDETQPQHRGVTISNGPDVAVGFTPQMGQPNAIRTFNTGATRNIDIDKLDFEGFLSPFVLERYATYMHKNRLQVDGSLRSSDNWQRGIPKTEYMKSGFRHFFAWWKKHRAGEDATEDLCALLFNVQGYLFESLK